MMKICVVGATGLVGSEMVRVLEEFNLGQYEFFPVASERSVGIPVRFQGEDHPVIGMQEAVDKEATDRHFFSRGGGFASMGACFCRRRNHSDRQFIGLETGKGYSAGRAGDQCRYSEPLRIRSSPIPNCSTIQMVHGAGPAAPEIPHQAGGGFNLPVGYRQRCQRLHTT
ncbi:MAG: hypothetical protein MZV49_05065 [Rhodopseudomonas palustris]|nr:hypothetical protein [Rhodopseudomonas palustris]